MGPGHVVFTQVYNQCHGGVPVGILDWELAVYYLIWYEEDVQEHLACTQMTSSRFEFHTFLPTKSDRMRSCIASAWWKRHLNYQRHPQTTV